MRTFTCIASTFFGGLFLFSFLITFAQGTAPPTKPLLHDGAAFQPFADVYELKITAGDPGPHSKRKKHNRASSLLLQTRVVAETHRLTASGLDRIQRNQAHIRKNKARNALKRA